MAKRQDITAKERTSAPRMNDSRFSGEKVQKGVAAGRGALRRAAARREKDSAHHGAPNKIFRSGPAP